MWMSLLIALTIVLPFGWGCTMYWLMARCWPAQTAKCKNAGHSDHGPSPYDYQI